MSGLLPLPVGVDVSKARPSVVFEKGSADYWELKDKREQEQLFESSDEGATPAEQLKKRGSHRAFNTPLSSRKSRRLSDQRKWLSEARRLTDRQVQEIAERDLSLDAAQQEQRSTQVRLSRIKDELEEERRKHDIAVAGLERELKELDLLVSDKEESLLVEKRRRGCLEDELCATQQKCVREQEVSHALRLQIENLENRFTQSAASAEELRVVAGKAEGEVGALHARVAKLQHDLECSESLRIKAQKQQRDHTVLVAELSQANQTLADLRKKASSSAASEQQLSSLRASHDDEVSRLRRQHELEVLSLRSTSDALRLQVKRLEDQVKEPREENTLRGQVNELLRENSRVREEKRSIQNDLSKASITARRLDRKYDTQQQKLNEANEKAALVPDLQQRIEDLEKKVSHLPLVYDATSPADVKIAGAVEQMRCAQEKEEAALQAAKARLNQLNDAVNERNTMSLELEKAQSQNEVLEREVATLTSDVRQLRHEREEQLERETITSARRTEELSESRSRDEEEVTRLRRNLEGVTKQVRQEVREVEQAFSDIFGWKISRGRHPVAWRVAPVNSAGKAQWKASELSVQRSDDDTYAVAPSPLLEKYEAQAGQIDPANPPHPSVVIAAMAREFTVQRD